MDPINKEEHFIKFEKEKTELKKEQFIKKIKEGLGEHIKNHGNKINVIRKSPWRRFMDKLMEIF